MTKPKRNQIQQSVRLSIHNSVRPKIWDDMWDSVWDGNFRTEVYDAMMPPYNPKSIRIEEMIKAKINESNSNY